MRLTKKHSLFSSWIMAEHRPPRGLVNFVGRFGNRLQGFARKTGVAQKSYQRVSNGQDVHEYDVAKHPSGWKA